MKGPMNNIASLQVRIPNVTTAAWPSQKRLRQSIQPSRSGGSCSAAEAKLSRAQPTARNLVMKIPRPIRSLAAILFSLLVGTVAMSAFFGLFLPMLLSVPAIGSQLGANTANVYAPGPTSLASITPITNAVPPPPGLIAKKYDFNRSHSLDQPLSLGIELASNPNQSGTR